MNIVIGSEKAGFNLKAAIVKDLEEKGHTVCDVGTLNGNDLVSFVEIADKASKILMSGAAERGILICGTGMGMALAANKHKGVYAAVVESEYAARYCRLINNANILCMGAFIVAPKLAVDMVDTFLNTGFLTDFEQWRINFLTGQQEAMRQLEAREFHD